MEDMEKDCFRLQKIPKPMAMVNGKPFLYYLIKQCKFNGINEIILLCGYKSEKIKKYFKNGKKFGLSIKYSFNPPDINTYKRLVDAKHLLKKIFYFYIPTIIHH